LPYCGSPPPGHVDRQIPGSSLCLWISQTDTNLLNAPLYPQGNFVGLKPTALAIRQYTDATGRTDRDVWQALGGYLGTVCVANCGQRTGFLGLGGEAAKVARQVAEVIAYLAPAATGYGAAFTAASTLSQQVERSQKGMSLNLGGILSAVGGVVGGANFGDYSFLGQLGSAGLNIAGAALTPQPQPTYISQPVYQAPQPFYQTPAPVMQAQPVMSAAPAFAVAAGAIARVTAPILNKIAVKLGLRARPSLSRAMEMVRKAAKLLTSPEATAAALGITVAELATLITTSSSRKRRRMNPANSKALRRAARRIKSFHKLCTHTDVLRSRGRRIGVRSSCGTCKKSPCRC